MKKRKVFLRAVVTLSIACLLINIGLFMSGGRLSIKLPLEHLEEYQNEKIDTFPSKLSVKENLIVDPNQNPVQLRGLMPPDPDRLSEEHRFNRELFVEIKKAGANVVRIPVPPERWVRDRDYLWRYLDPSVTWAGESGLYLIIDWHYIGNIMTGEGPQMPDIEDHPYDLTLEFWRSTAHYFRNAPHVIFEIFNEPQGISARDWQSRATQIVQAIREQGAEQMVIVGGIDYGKDLSWVLERPIQDHNVAYASHIYPAHSRDTWQFYFGEVSETYPVVMTEWGFMNNSTDSASKYLVGNADSYGKPLLTFLDEHQVGWIACWYDDQWLPPIFQEGWKVYTDYGEFVRVALQDCGTCP